MSVSRNYERKSSAALSVPSTQVFQTISDRDNYFSVNPHLLVTGVSCVVLDNPSGGLFQVYNGSSWESRSSVIMGPIGPRGVQGPSGAAIQSASFIGDDLVFTDSTGNSVPVADAKQILKGERGYETIFQFAKNPNGPFYSPEVYKQDPTDYVYWRWSTDGGSTWTPNGIKFRPDEVSLATGEGLSFSQGVLSLTAGGPDTIGGFKVGTGLQVDGSGKLSASASSEVTKVLPNESAMLSLAVEELRPYRVIRLDTNRLYFLNSGDSPSVLGNWFTGPSIDQVALSFNGRTGSVVPEFGDYNTDLVPSVDVSTSVKYKFVIDTGVLYIENTDNNERTQIAKDSDLTAFQEQVNSLTTVITNPSTGLVDKVGNLETQTESLNNEVNAPSTGLVDKVSALENFTNQKGQPSGIAPLGTASKVPTSFLPDYLPQRKRTWKGVLASRGEGIWYTNTSPNEREVHIVSDNVNSGGYVNILVRENATSNTYNFIVNTMNLSPDGLSSRSFSTVTVPQGWQYQVSPDNIGTRDLASWYELD